MFACLTSDVSTGFGNSVLGICISSEKQISLWNSFVNEFVCGRDFTNSKTNMFSCGFVLTKYHHRLIRFPMFRDVWSERL